jgi:DNA-binding transcriptional LysR family regulator
MKSWLGVEFRHLAALAAIAEEGSFRAAAERLGYVQSAVSQQLAFLERTVGVRLVERGRGSAPVELTGAGELLLGHVDAIQGSLAAAWADMHAVSDGRAGSVRVAASASAEALVVPAVVPLLDARIAITVVRVVDDAACAALLEHAADAALTSGPVPAGPLLSHRLLADPLVLVVPCAHPLAANEGPLRPGDIDGLDLIVRRTGHDAASPLLARGRVVHATDDDATARALVARGVGAAILPALAVAPGEDVVARPAGGQRELSLVWHAGRALTATLEAFCDAAIAAGRDLQRRAAR